MDRHLIVACMAVAALAAPAVAQDESALRSYFEGRRVTLRIDMPGTSDGVDVRADSARPLDSQRYGDRLKEDGTAIHAGDSVVVTLVKVKKDLIEFQLAGGGYGTFGEDTSTSVYMPHVEKSDREKELERRVRDEDDREERRRLQRELDELRDKRERENRRIDAERAIAEQHKRELLASRRLAGGSRFNLRYDGSVPRGITPNDVMAALAEYVDFSGFRAPAAPIASSASARLDPERLPRKGMTRAEAERAYGAPAGFSERREGGITVSTLRFVVGDQQITGDFVEDVLVGYTITSR